MNRIINTFFIFFTALVIAQTQARTLPPGAVIVKDSVIFDNIHFGVSNHYGINGVPGVDDWYGQGFPVPYNADPQPDSYPNIELMTQYQSAGWFRDFYPAAKTLWNPTDGLGLTALTGLLDEADALHNLGKKLLWTPFGFSHTTKIWDAEINTDAHEQEIIDFATALLTSAHTNPGGFGYTFANHPAIAAFEPFNEQIRSTTATTYKAAYARAVRIYTKLFEQYKPDCRVITYTVQGGEGSNLVTIMRASAESILSPKVATNGDDGTGKTAADYFDVHSHHFYQEGLETKATYDAWVSDNTFSTKNNYILHLNHAIVPYYAETKFNPSSPLYGKPMDSIPIWNTESGIAPNESYGSLLPDTDPNRGIRWWMFDEEEAFHNLMKWFVPISFYLQDGLGGPGVNFAYKSDLNGIGYTGPLGSTGTITNVVSGSESRIRLTVSNTPGNTPSVDWRENMRIVIESPTGGWADLGLAAGEKKRYVTHVIDGTNRILELKGTTFTAAPTGTINYTEYQLSHSPYPEEFKRMVDLLTSGPCSFGWIPYGDQMGVCIVTPEATYYTDVDGNMKTWFLWWVILLIGAKIKPVIKEELRQAA